MKYNGNWYFNCMSLTQLVYYQHYAYQKYLQQELKFLIQKRKNHLALYFANHILDLPNIKQLGFFRQNIIYTHPFCNWWNIKEFGCNVLIITLRFKSMMCNNPSKTNRFCIRLGHISITIITALFYVGVCCPIIFGITFVITDLKLRL